MDDLVPNKPVPRKAPVNQKPYRDRKLSNSSNVNSNSFLSNSNSSMNQSVLYDINQFDVPNKKIVSFADENESIVSSEHSGFSSF